MLQANWNINDLQISIHMPIKLTNTLEDDIVVVYAEGDLPLLGRQFRAPLGRSSGPYSITLKQQKLESGLNGSYCVPMYSIVLL